MNISAWAKLPPVPNPREIIRREYGSSSNMFTPKKLAFGMIGKDTAYELSQGDLDGEPLYGVSVVRELADGTTERLGEPESTCFQSIALARRHIARLKMAWVPEDWEDEHVEPVPPL